MTKEIETREQREKRELDEELNRQLEQTFPASDPQSWTLGTDHRDESHEDDKEEEQRTDPRNSTKG